MKVKIRYTEKDVEEIYSVDKVVNWSAINEVGLWVGQVRTVYGQKKRIMQVEIIED